MAESDIFCLRMQEFNKNIGISWQELQIETNFCDVTLACEDKQIKAHKVIISSCSPVLRNILKLNQNPHPLIYLRRVKYKDLQNLLNFMYQGEVNVAEEDFTSFLEVAEDLNIRGLSEGNKEGYNAKLKIPLQATHESTAKRKRTVEKIIIEDIKEANYIETSNEFGQACDNFADNESKISISSIECNQIKQKNNEDNKQSLVSIVAEKKFPCGKCDFKAKYKNDLKVHIESTHDGVRYPCDQCDYKAKQKSRLKIHKDSIHEGVLHPCDQCEYKATQKSHLRTHMVKYH